MDHLSDAELLTGWQEQRSEQAFASLARRYAGLVYHAALRVCRDPATAAEASQLTFITLARKAGSLASRDSLAGWLHVTGMMQARNLVQLAKRESRKRDELEHHLGTMSLEDAPQTVWTNLEPVLDDALAALSPVDRQTILLRHYRSCSIREIATSFSISVDAAQKRLDRAMERLRFQLARRGYASCTALAAALSAGFSSNAEAGLAMAGSFSSGAINAVSGSGTSSSLTFSTFLMSKKPALALVALALLIGTLALILHRLKEPVVPAPIEAGPQAAGRTEAFRPDLSQTASEAKKALDNLIATYGEERTNRSRHLSDLVIARSKLTHEILGHFYKSESRRMRLSAVPLRSSVELSTEQKVQADQVIRDFLQRQMAFENRELEKITRKPWPLVELLLASDACSRGEISPERYQSIRSGLAEQVRIFADPVGPEGRSFSPGAFGMPQTDPTFVSQFREILDPGQLAAFNDDLRVFEETLAREGDRSTFASLEPNDLDLLAKKTEATLKFMEGLSAVMEGENDSVSEDKSE